MDAPTEESLAAVLAGLAVPAAITDTDGTVVAASDALAENLGRDALEEGTSLLDVVADREREQAVGPLAAEEETTVTLDLLVDGDPERRLVTFTPLPAGVLWRVGDGGAADGSPGSRLAALVESAPLAIVTLHLDGAVASWNAAAASLFGRRESEVVGRPPPFIPQRARPEWERQCERVRRGETVRNVETRWQTADGTPLDVSISLSPLSGEDGSVAGIVAIVADITERTEREQRLEVLNRLIRHNMGNDMSVILGHAERLREGVEDPDLAGSAETIVRTGRELSRLSEKARKASTAFEGRQRVESIDVGALVRHVTARLARQHPEASVRVDGPTSAVVSAIDAIELAIENLVENAVVHSETDEPTIEVTVEPVRVDETPWVAVHVADEAPPIPIDDQQALIEGTETQLLHGSGLGLWLVHWIVRKSGGELDFERQDDRGNVVTVRLRRAEEALY